MTVTVRRRDQWILRLSPRALRLKIEGCQRHLQSDGEPWPRAWDLVRRQRAVMEQRLAELQEGGP